MRAFPLLLLLVACAGDDGPTDDTSQLSACDPGNEPTLVIGSGHLAFEEVADGGEVELVHGPQGGYHLELGLRATHIDASELIAATVGGTYQGAPVASAVPFLEFHCNPETDTLDAWAIRLIYSGGEDDIPYADLDEQTTEITATLTDASGLEVSATATLTIQDPSYP